MNKVDLLFERHSVRQYADGAVAPQDLELILQAGMSAPSAVNSQPWEFLVVQERARLNECATIRKFWGMLAKAPLAIIVNANLEGYKGSNRDFFIQDCSAAAENMLLAATALGYGGVWLGVHPLEEPQEQLRKLFHIPREIMPVVLLSIGKPLTPAERKPRVTPEKVHYERY